MRAALDQYWRTAMNPTPQSTTERKRPKPTKTLSVRPNAPVIQLYFAVGLRRFPLLQSHEVTPENVIAAVEHAAKLMQQKAGAK
jgi:hypothetical protein